MTNEAVAIGDQRESERRRVACDENALRAGPGRLWAFECGSPAATVPWENCRQLVRYAEASSRMNFFRAFRPQARPAADVAVKSDHFPAVNAFVNVATGGKTESLPIESIERLQFEVRRPSRAAVGMTALFDYANALGRFRFHANCAAVLDRTAFFDLPAHIMVVDKSDNRTFRMDCVIPVLWRYAPGGEGYGAFMRSFTANLSAGGVAFVVPRALRAGTQVELELTLDEAPAFVVIGTLTRPTVQNRSNHLAGTAFDELTPAGANAIDNFIASRERSRRERGIANH
jgi:hypothetical protein